MSMYVVLVNNKCTMEDCDKQSTFIEATEENIRKEAERQQKIEESEDFSLIPQFQQICYTSDVPSGWIKVDDRWDPTRCGNPTSIVYNVWVIRKYIDLPVGTVLNVCASASTPSGWVEINTRWDPTSCGHPSRITQNISVIRRIS